MQALRSSGRTLVLATSPHGIATKKISIDVGFSSSSYISNVVYGKLCISDTFQKRIK
jgi:hypothetical protein